MTPFIMIGNYSSNAFKDMSGKRTGKVVDIIKKHHGEIRSMYATLGASDLFFVIDFPSTEDALKASVAMSKLTGISFSTSPAFTVEDFDRLLEEL